jgi:PAS domain S-box-containing protein
MTSDRFSTDGKRVLPLVSDDGNRNLLIEWIKDHSTYEAVGLAGNIENSNFDVCIVDKGAFEEHHEALRAKKAEAAPVLLPYLLLLPKRGAEIINTDAGQLADNVVTETIDEIVSLPIQQAELHWRLTALFRLREQSLDLRQRERELERQVDLFEKAQHMASIGAWEYDIVNDENWWTDEVFRIYQYSGETAPSAEEGLQYYHPEDRPIIKEAFQTAVEEGEPYDVEVRLIGAEDDQRWVRTRGEPQYEDEKPTRVRGTIQDITERKERERDLQRIKQAVQSADHAIYITDTDGTIEYVNPGFEELTGFTQSEVVGDTPRVLDSGTMSDTYFDDLWETIRSGNVWQEEIINRRKNGEAYTASQTIAPVTDGDDIHAFVAIQEDITERKEREAALRRRKQAVDAAPIGVSLSDPNQEDNPLIYVNDAFVEITGYSRDDVLGKNCRCLQGENTDPDQVAIIREAIQAQKPVSIDLRNYRKDGTEFWNHLEIAPVKNDTGEVINYIGFQQDVTGRKQRQEQLGVLDRVLRHNLRNDMNVIRGQAETIQAKTSNEIAGAARVIMDKSDELIGLAEKERQITNLLREPPTQEAIDVCNRLQQIISRVESKHPEAKISVDCPEERTIKATSEFDQAITEIVTNAIVHNDSPSPEVALTVTVGDETVHITIADTCSRIPEMERNVLLNESEQTPLYHGGGLGLWLVNLIITRSNGTISFEENSQTGNIISIELPQ